jgi:hypothetical protein
MERFADCQSQPVVTDRHKWSRALLGEFRPEPDLDIDLTMRNIC